MGWPPPVTLQCTAWEFWSAFNGWQLANNPANDVEPMTRNELDDLIRKHGLNGG